MSPKAFVRSSLGDVKDRLDRLESEFSQVKDRLYQIELPGDTVAQEVDRLRDNADSTVAEMRQLRDCQVGLARTTKKICKGYEEAMHAHFKEAEESLLKHKEENKRQRAILSSFVHDKEKQMAKAKDIRKLIDPLVKQMDEAKSDALTKATEIYEQSIGNISELPDKVVAWKEDKVLQAKVVALEERLAAFEVVVFSIIDSNGNYASHDPYKVVAGRLCVSQQEASRSRSASRER